MVREVVSRASEQLSRSTHPPRGLPEAISAIEERIAPYRRGRGGRRRGRGAHVAETPAEPAEAPIENAAEAPAHGVRASAGR